MSSRDDAGMSVSPKANALSLIAERVLNLFVWAGHGKYVTPIGDQYAIMFDGADYSHGFPRNFAATQLETVLTTSRHLGAFLMLMTPHPLLPSHSCATVYNSPHRPLGHGFCFLKCAHREGSDVLNGSFEQIDPRALSRGEQAIFEDARGCDEDDIRGRWQGGSSAEGTRVDKSEL
jgi:hypothetical protein